jgi:type I restriction enzyme, S subunit
MTLNRGVKRRESLDEKSCPLVPLGEVVTTQYGVSTPEAAGGNAPIVGMQHIVNGRVRLSDLPRASLTAEELVRYRLSDGDILFNRTNSAAQVGKTGIVVGAEGLSAVFASYIVRLRVNEAKVIPEYVNLWMNSASAVKQLRRLATPGVSQFNINADVLKNRFLIPLPSLEKQADLAAFAALCDDECRTLDSVLLAKRHFKRGILGPLLTGRIRFPHAALQDWTLIRLGDALVESREIGSSGISARKLTIKLYGRGVVAKRDGRLGSKNTQYHRRSAGQFIYSKLDFLNGAFGIVPPQLDGYESTLDLPAFNVSRDINIRWLLHLFSWTGFYKTQVRLANGGRKARRISPPDLLKVVVSIPSRDEQDAIAEFVDALDQEIALLEQLLRAVESQKRALLERLLSGKLRLTAV